MRSLNFWIAAVVSLGSVQAAEQISVKDAKIDNVQLHYLTADHRPAMVILCTGLRKLRGCGDRLFPSSRKGSR
jgi:hypothetical protein